MSLDPMLRLDRVLPDLFDELAGARTPDYLEAAIERASSRPQRPRWTFPERWIPVDIATRPVQAQRFAARTIGILALIGLLIAAGLAAVYTGARSRVPAPPFGLAANGQIAFTENGAIRTVDQVTGRVSDLIVGTAVVGKPSYSRDGRKIAFVRDAGGPHDEVVVAAADGSQALVVTPPGTERVMAVHFAPSGDQVVIEAYRAGVRSLAVAAVDRSDFRWLAIDGEATRAAFLPTSGSTLLFVSGGPGAEGETIEGIDLETGQRTIVVPPIAYGEFVGAPSVSPDGSRFAFARWITQGPQHAESNTYIVASDGSGAPSMVPPAPGMCCQGYPAWSNDGSRLAFLRSYDDHAAVVVVRADLHGSAREIRIATTYDVTLSWSPDDRYVLGVVNREYDDVAIEHLLVDVETGLLAETKWDRNGAAVYQRRAP
jgi:Tol biopolymer transport system component